MYTYCNECNTHTCDNISDRYMCDGTPPSFRSYRRFWMYKYLYNVYIMYFFLFGGEIIGSSEHIYDVLKQPIDPLPIQSN